MYEEIITKWFEKRETPNKQFAIWDLTIILLGYYNEYFGKECLERETDIVKKELIILGYTKIYKKVCFNVSLRKIKELLKPFNKIGELEITGYSHSKMILYKIGWILRMYDKGFEIRKRDNKN